MITTIIALLLLCIPDALILVSLPSNVRSSSAHLPHTSSNTMYLGYHVKTTVCRPAHTYPNVFLSSELRHVAGK